MTENYAGMQKITRLRGKEYGTVTGNTSEKCCRDISHRPETR